jgi:hypothetical protein
LKVHARDKQRVFDFWWFFEIEIFQIIKHPYTFVKQSTVVEYMPLCCLAAFIVQVKNAKLKKPKKVKTF